MKTTVTLLAAAGCLAVAQSASAGFMRCGGQIISDSGRNAPGKYEVLKKCGQPTAQFGNTWIYERGGSKKVVHFHDSGQVSSIQDG